MTTKAPRQCAELQEVDAGARNVAESARGRRLLKWMWQQHINVANGALLSPFFSLFF